MISKFRIVQEGPQELIFTPEEMGDGQPTSNIYGPPSWLDVECLRCGAKWRAIESSSGQPGTYQALIFGGVTEIICKTPGCGN
jgi:hypothetical protein